MGPRIAGVALAVLLVLLAPLAQGAVHEVRTTRTGDAAKPHAFEPENLTIAVGDTVRWVNGDGVYHTVKSSSNTSANAPSDLFGATLPSEGANHSFTFNDTGAFRYFCQPHAGFMWGIITVAVASGTPPPPPTHMDPPPSSTPGGAGETGGAQSTPGLPLLVMLAGIFLLAQARRRG